MRSLKGLKARAFFAYDYTNLAQKEMKTACTFYTYDSVQDTYNPITKVAKGELMEKTQPYYKDYLSAILIELQEYIQ